MTLFSRVAFIAGLASATISYAGDRAIKQTFFKGNLWEVILEDSSENGLKPYSCVIQTTLWPEKQFSIGYYRKNETTGFIGMFARKNGWNLPVVDPPKTATVTITSDKNLAVRNYDRRIIGIGFNSLYVMNAVADDTLSISFETGADFTYKDPELKLRAAIALLSSPTEFAQALQQPGTTEALALFQFLEVYESLFGLRGATVGMKISFEGNEPAWLVPAISLYEADQVKRSLSACIAVMADENSRGEQTSPLSDIK